MNSLQTGKPVHFVEIRQVVESRQTQSAIVSIVFPIASMYAVYAANMTGVYWR
jgi:hypothetical protein